MYIYTRLLFAQTSCCIVHAPRRAARMNSRTFGRADGDGFQPAICIIPLPADCLIPSRSRECDSRNLLRSPVHRTSSVHRPAEIRTPVVEAKLRRAAPRCAPSSRSFPSIENRGFDQRVSLEERPTALVRCEYSQNFVPHPSRGNSCGRYCRVAPDEWR